MKKLIASLILVFSVQTHARTEQFTYYSSEEANQACQQRTEQLMRRAVSLGKELRLQSYQVTQVGKKYKCTVRYQFIKK